MNPWPHSATTTPTTGLRKLQPSVTEQGTVQRQVGPSTMAFVFPVQKLDLPTEETTYKEKQEIFQSVDGCAVQRS